MSICTISHLQKTYADGTHAVEDVSFSIAKGDFFALLGQNGAGKTTTISILSGLIQKTSGKVLIDKFDLDTHFSEAKACIGVVPQEFNFFPFARVIDIITDQAGYYGIAKKDCIEYAEYLLKKLSLWEKRFSEARALSGGMKRRLMIARGLIHKPKILLLDEPTAGVDVELRRGMWDFLKELHASGTTIVLTTHYLEEVEQLCNRLVLLSKGKKVLEGSVKEVIAEYKQQAFLLLLSPLPKEILNLVKKTSSLQVISEQEYQLTIAPQKTLLQMLESLSFLSPYLISIKPKENALEQLIAA